MEKWEALKADFRVQITHLRRHDFEKYTKMMDRLARQLSRHGGGAVSEQDFFSSVGQDEENFVVFMVRHLDQPEGECVGVATVFFRQLLLSGWIAEIHDVVVDEDKYRRQGYGRLLTQHIFDYVQHRAEQLGRPIKLMLTSAPAREAANAMYVQSGFELIAHAAMVGDGYVDGATNLYMKIISP